MATLERIRRRSGLLIIVIGIAMLGFILTDLLGSGDSLFRADATVVGKVDGRTVEYNEFTTLMEERQAMIAQQNPQQAQFITNKQIADAVWDQIIREQLMGEQYEKLGFRITSGELYRRLQQNPSLQQGFADETGRFNEGRFQQYLTSIQENRQMDPQAAQAYDQWIDFEASVKTNALQTKYNSAVQKGIYVPGKIARAMYERRNTQTQAQFAVLPYTTIADSAVSVEESDLKAYYQEHKEEYKTEQTASIQYVNFPINASEEDRQDVQRELREYLEPQIIDVNGTTDTMETFDNAEEDSLFAAARSDQRVTGDYYRHDNLPVGLDSSIFEQEVGSVVGPYRSGETFKLSKIVDKSTLPDSVNARHILLSFQGAQRGNEERTFEQAQELADSLLTLVEGDSAQFSALARQYSDDAGSGASGGNLGWFDDQTMVKPFSNFAFRNDVGEIGMVTSQFGIHIIQILDQAGETPAVRLFHITRNIEPSDATIDSIYNRAGALATSVESAEGFAQKAQELGYSPRPVNDLKSFDENIVGLGNNREIVQWAHNEDSEVGDIQLFSNNNDSYVVAVLTGFSEEGYRPFEAVKESIRPQVIQKKKAEMLKQRFAEAMQHNEDLQAIANAAGATVGNQTVNFGASAITGYGNEPKVVGVMTAIEPNKLSKPVAGSRGVYLVKVSSGQAPQELPSYTAEQQQQAQSTRALVSNQLFLSLKENAKIEDRRAKFF